MKKQLAVVGLSAGLAAGGAAGFVFTSGSPFAGAERVVAEGASGTPTTVAGSSDSTSPRSRSTTDSGGTGATAGAGDSMSRPDPSARLQEALRGLVDDETLTQEQADKVVAAIIAAQPERGMGGGPGGHGGREGSGGPGGPGLDAAATAIGVTVDELRTALQSGKSIADVAAEKNVEVAKVVEAMVADMKAHFAEEVASGEHTQAEVDQRLADIEERITARVNGEAPTK